MKITVATIAQDADVSIGTVSRVLNNDPSVSEELRDRVKTAVSKLDYKPLRRRTKRGAVKGSPLSNMNIALVLLGMDRSLETLPVVASAIHGAEAAISDFGGNILLADSPDLKRMPAWLDENKVHGVILKGALQGDTISKTNNRLVTRLRELPSIWLLGRPEGCWGDAVGADDLEVGKIAAEHLLARGHRNIAFINPKPDHVTFRRRQASFAFSIEQGGGQVAHYVGDEPESWSLPLCPVEDVQCVAELVDRALSCTPCPTAIFSPADSITVLIYRALAARGISVGDDISVISVNKEASLIKALYPTVTTISVHATLIGRRAVELLHWRVSHKGGSPMTIGLQPELVEGDSVADLS